MKPVVMLGPSPASRGGMATVIGILLEHGYGADGSCRFIATHVDGGRLRKAARAGAALAQFGALLLAGRVSLLHVHVASGASFWRKAAFIGAARLFGCPVLFHLHGGRFREFVDVRLSGWRQRLALFLIGGACAAFALSDDAARWLRERCGIAAVEVFPNPIVARVPAPGLRGADILFIGRLEEKKGVFDLLHGFAAIHAAHPAARLVLAGEGDRAAVLALAGRLGIGDRLLLPGWVGESERAALLSTAALFVLPSHEEQMPMVLLEAMACGTPIVASDVGAIPQMLVDGNNNKFGIVVPVKNIDHLAAAILKILNDNILADTFSAGGLERVQSEYLVEKVLNRLRRRYEELAV